MEVINKLLINQLISEEADQNDKRARLITLTEKGKLILNECYGQSARVSKMIFGDMDHDSVNLCISLLKDTEERHSRLAIELRNKDFEEMYRVVCNDSETSTSQLLKH
jgi:DNA-binding MarR family transcriptional regulator